MSSWFLHLPVCLGTYLWVLWDSFPVNYGRNCLSFKTGNWGKSIGGQVAPKYFSLHPHCKAWGFLPGFQFISPARLASLALKHLQTHLRHLRDRNVVWEDSRLMVQCRQNPPPPPPEYFHSSFYPMSSRHLPQSQEVGTTLFLQLGKLCCSQQLTVLRLQQLYL